ncbi:MAG: nicotinate-nucleotide--dimethylbenzimidazole phosphoribosyltransferase [Pseudomonadota bacterium]
MAPMTDPEFHARLRRAIDEKTKPIGALGRVEALAEQIALAQTTLTPRLRTAELIIFAADHGIAAEGVSAFPSAVTGQMVLNFLAGGAAANVFARGLDIPVRVVDAGVATHLDHPDLIDRRMGAGTANSALGPAMPAETCAAARAAGAELAKTSPADVLCFGEMGIANTAAAALVAHKTSGLSLDLLVGRGTGLDDDGLALKRAVLARAASRTGALSPGEALAQYGGFEIAMMAGAMAGGAEAGKIIIVDGFIAGAAASVVLAEALQLKNALVFAHLSAEAGHRALTEHLGVRPLLDLEMRLGEGTGALLAWPLVRAAADMLCDMASFAEAGVSEKA